MSTNNNINMASPRSSNNGYVTPPPSSPRSSNNGFVTPPLNPRPSNNVLLQRVEERGVELRRIERSRNPRTSGVGGGMTPTQLDFPEGYYPPVEPKNPFFITKKGLSVHNGPNQPQNIGNEDKRCVACLDSKPANHRNFTMWPETCAHVPKTCLECSRKWIGEYQKDSCLWCRGPLNP